MKKWLVPAIMAVVIFTLLFFAFRNREFPYPNAVWVESFTLSGVFLLFGAGFIIIDSFGAFDVAAYGVKKIFRVFKKPDVNDDFANSYFEYKVARNEREKVPIFPIFFVGSVFLLIGLLIYFIS